MEVLRSDAIVVGCGIAGATAAFEIAKGGKNVSLLAAAKNKWENNSSRAQGGIIYRNIQDDSEELLKQDIMLAGAGACDERVVDQFVKIGPPLVKKLLIDELKVPFSDGLTKEAAHSCCRILFAQDQTGAAIMEHLLRSVSLHKNIFFKTDEHVFKLYVEEGKCLGVYTLSRGRLFLHLAPHVILATGGVGDLYLNTSNTREAKGDGLALVAEHGLPFRGLQYVQFHPTSLLRKNARCYLLSEALRGEGARLLGADKKPLKVGDLAPRDVLTRAIDEEMREKKLQHVWLDCRHKNAKQLQERFPKLYEICLADGYDMARQLIPVVPCAHYLCGGIAAQLDGSVGMEGLYAIGEVAGTGLHGANRLASTSLLEGLLMGKLCAEKILEARQHPTPFTKAKELKWGSLEAKEEVIENALQQLRLLMWESVGIVRREEALKQALATMNLMQLRWHNLKLHPKAVRFRNALLASKLIAEAAIAAKTSRGCHLLI